ncbi:isopenicillin N synthase family oxygenase [Alphaproteobacteria bacterium]|nr:isopenicillin N synthase family oxygenase [Alphaproteobacteria bacterium]
MGEKRYDHDIPVIDVAPYLNGNKNEKIEVAALISTACENSGFFCITGHGVEENLIAKTRHAGAKFFSSTYEAKLNVLRSSNRTGCGYYPVADRALAKTLGVDTPPDLQEAWAMTRENVPDEPYYQEGVGRFFFAPNKWPEGLPGFRETLVEYFETMSTLGQKLMGLLALALRLDENYFADKVDKATNQFRFIYYPPQESFPETNQLRAGAHTDYGALTMLRGDDVPGTLQVKLPTVGWTDIRPPANAFVCNLGDAMAHWTGGRWASTLHRVANPTPGVAPQEVLNKGRMTLVFFHTPNHDVVLSGLTDTAAEQPGITVAEHYQRKIRSAVDTTPPAA